MTDLPTVLVVDDSEDNQAYAIAVLADIDVQVDVASSTEEALKQLEANEVLPVLCVIDANMPGQDGYEMLNRLFSQERYLPLPVLLLTENLSDGKQRLHQALAKAVDTMSKPIRPSLLREHVECYLQIARYRDQLRAVGKTNEGEEDFWESSSEAVIAVGREGEIRFVNAVASRFLGVRPKDLVGTSVEALLEEPNANMESKWTKHPIPTMCAKGNALQIEEGHLWIADGKKSGVKLVAIPMSGVDDIEVVLAFKPLKKETRKNKKSKVNLKSDNLTGLPLRSTLEAFLAKIIEDGSTDQSCAAVMVDLDHFKNINQSLGFDVGDQLLQAVVKRIRACLRSDDMLGRIGGDEFVIVLPGLSMPEDAGTIAQKIIDCLSEAFLIGGHELFISASLGIATYPSCGDDPKSLMHNAELAVARAKGIGRNNYQFFNTAMNTQRLRRLELVQDFHKALEQGDLVIEYQPIIQGQSLQCIGFTSEAVWHHRRGTQRGAAIYQLVEELELNQGFSVWFWETALRAVARLNDSGLSLYGLPLLPNQLMSEKFWHWVDLRLEQLQLKPQRILLQLPESVILSRHREWQPMLKRLRERGFVLALADFGTGYAPLALLKQTPLSLLQLGEALLQPSTSESGIVTLDKTDTTMVKGIVDIAHELGMTLWAPRVEHEVQWHFLREIGCDYLGGEYLADPVSLDEGVDLSAVLNQLNERALSLSAPPTKP